MRTGCGGGGPLTCQTLSPWVQGGDLLPAGGCSPRRPVPPAPSWLAGPPRPVPARPSRGAESESGRGLGAGDRVRLRPRELTARPGSAGGGEGRPQVGARPGDRAAPPPPAMAHPGPLRACTPHPCGASPAPGPRSRAAASTSYLSALCPPNRQVAEARARPPPGASRTRTRTHRTAAPGPAEASRQRAAAGGSALPPLVAGGVALKGAARAPWAWSPRGARSTVPPPPRKVQAWVLTGGTRGGGQRPGQGPAAPGATPGIRTWAGPRSSRWAARCPAGSAAVCGGAKRGGQVPGPSGPPAGPGPEPPRGRQPLPGRQRPCCPTLPTPRVRQAGAVPALGGPAGGPSQHLPPPPTPPARC